MVKRVTHTMTQKRSSCVKTESSVQARTTAATTHPMKQAMSSEGIMTTMIIAGIQVTTATHAKPSNNVGHIDQTPQTLTEVIMDANSVVVQVVDAGTDVDTVQVVEKDTNIAAVQVVETVRDIVTVRMMVANIIGITVQVARQDTSIARHRTMTVSVDDADASNTQTTDAPRRARGDIRDE